ncbi:MAG: DUF6076 domain-containing protein [Angelakisella sp.]
MSKKVYLIQDILTLINDDKGADKRRQSFFELGNSLCNFLWCDEDTIFHFYCNMAFDYALNCVVQDDLADSTADFVIVDANEDLNALSPYFQFFSAYFSTFVLEMEADKASAYVNLIDKLELSLPSLPSEGFEEENYRNFKNHFPFEAPAPEAEQKLKVYLMAAYFIHAAIQMTQRAISKELDFICETNADMQKLDGMKRLYLLDYKRKESGKAPYYMTAPIEATFESNIQIPNTVLSYTDMQMFLSRDDVKICGVTYVNTLGDLIRYELIQVIQKGLPLKKCKYCGQYFSPRGRSDIEYCPRVKPKENKPCDQIGAMKLYQAEKGEDVTHAAYLKAYRRMNAKARTKRITQTEFYAWSEEARIKREECKKKLLSFDEYQSWLNEDKNK